MHENGQGMAAVTVQSDMGHTVQSLANGSYEIRGLDPGTYVVVPLLEGYRFQPPSREIVLPPNAYGQDFTAISLTPTPLPYPAP